jgi:non-specific serine/threonine protein kinase
MLETIREFARERLVESVDEAELCERHAAHFLTLGEEAAPHVLRHERSWGDRLEAEHDNLRAALDHFEQRGEWQYALRLGAALSEFWGARGHLPEGLRRLETALAADDEPTAARANALSWSADLAYGAGSIELSRERAEAALDLARTHGNVWVEASAVAVIASLVQDAGDSRSARDLWEQSSRLFREAGDQGNALFADRLVAWMHGVLGERERAIALYEETLQRAREIGDDYAVAQCLDGLGSLALDEGRLREAADMVDEAYDLYVRLDERYRIPIQVARFSWILAAAGQPADAARVLAAAEAELERMGAVSPGWLAVSNDEVRASALEQLGDESFTGAWRAGEKLTPEAAADLAREALGRAQRGYRSGL